MQPDKKQFFKYVNNKLKSRPQITSLAKNGQNVTTSVEQANVLNDQFCSVFTKDDRLEVDCNVNCTENIDTVFICCKIVEDSLENLTDSPSCGPDFLPSCFLKKCAVQLSNPLSKIFSDSLKIGKLPQKWKTGKIIPIYKGKGRKCEASNYRPIRLTSIFCKVFERIIRGDIVDHLDRTGLISKAQHGFFSGKSTQTQLLECINDWTKGLDSRNSIDVFYLDISKAFDTVSHPKLLKKLTSYGISGNLHKWISDFLSNRTQFVSVKNARSYLTFISPLPSTTQRFVIRNRLQHRKSLVNTNNTALHRTRPKC